jgi:hypothetical protein
MGEPWDAEEIRLRVACLTAESAVIRAEADEAVRESQRLQAEARQLAHELREIRARRRSRSP